MTASSSSSSSSRSVTVTKSEAIFQKLPVLAAGQSDGERADDASVLASSKNLELNSETWVQAHGNQTETAELADAGRRLLARAEVEARQGAGYHAPLAERGEDLRGAGAGDRAQSAASEWLLQVATYRVSNLNRRELVCEHASS
jgi:hypothetical protein